MARPRKKKVDEVKVEPIALDLGKPIDGKVFKGETFEIQKTTKGILYHLYGGYNIFVTPNNASLYETLNDLIENSVEYSKFTGDEKDNFETFISATAFVLNVPLIAFSNSDFMFKIANNVVDYLQQSYDNAMKNELQEETVEEDEQFKEAVLGIETIKQALKEENDNA